MVKYRALKGVLMTSFGEEHYIVKARRLDVNKENSVIAVNGVAAFYWEQLGEPKTAGELLDALASEYSVSDPECARGDLERLLGEWLAGGYIDKIEE